MRLSNRRTSNGFGANPITWSDMASFVALSGLHLAPWEVETIELLDALWMTEQSKALGASPQGNADGAADGRQSGRNPTHR